MSEQVIAIGDIHGCARSLKALWKKLEPYKESLHIFVGDYIDRGPGSRQVIDFLLAACEERECIFLRGNHEQMLLDALQKNRYAHWMINGGDRTLKSYGDTTELTNLPDEHLEFYEHTLPYFENDDYFFVHAGAPSYQTLEKSKKDPESSYYFLWGRDHLNALSTPWEKIVVFGHTPRPNPILKPKMIGIDTGCVYDRVGYGKLTAVVLPETTFIQQISMD